MITPERKARIARENGAKSKGPKTEEGKDKCARNAIRHGERAQTLKPVVPPHSACLANEDRQAFYKLYDNVRAKFRPADDIEVAITREIADFQWKSIRNKQLESAIFDREIARQSAAAPELGKLEITLAAHEALTRNRTVFELRKDTQICLRAGAQLQRRLLQLQKSWPPAEMIQPNEQTNPNSENAQQTYDSSGLETPSAVRIYRNIFLNNDFEIYGREPIPVPDAA